MVYFSSHTSPSNWGKGILYTLSSSLCSEYRSIYEHPVFTPPSSLEKLYTNKNAQYKEHDILYQNYVVNSLIIYLSKTNSDKQYCEDLANNFIWGRLGEKRILKELRLYDGDTFLSREGNTRHSLRDPICYWLTINGCVVCKDGLIKNENEEEE